MGPWENSSLLSLYLTPSCITLLYWSLGVHRAAFMCVFCIHQNDKGHSMPHLSYPFSLKCIQQHRHIIFYFNFYHCIPQVAPKPVALTLSLSSQRMLNPVCFLYFRDFAYVARDKNTRILKCHVFRCDTPAKAIATSLHEICSRVSVSDTKPKLGFRTTVSFWGGTILD